MDLSHIILGPVVTEKAERLRTEHTHTLRVAPKATKIDVKAALKRYYDVDVTSIRVLRTHGKEKAMPRGGTMEKRHPYKKMIITLSKKSKSLDLVSFKM
ncbi:TPA: 50S ribosomal protein L23 [Candidatus Peribacteria bacterium]|nr:MAG: 50S ribosomal protein L23 [Candidatus Peribacteria bacterium RIFOXYC2_FULL_58_10]OGJ84924.1 MAG: 50S ribosomal protein L23 [Candidatus Peribacteria bacterium RIFOXYD2_FULL_58_15]HAI99004.1 50S ribosomal protein L23 [Candidatus Peribacteria bacterium]HAS34809.1 50S ribosomal protein L23 [Candidatus Peribacteria bacterium]